MIVTSTEIANLHIFKSSTFQDVRGEFSRLYCAHELAPFLGQRNIVQINRSVTYKVGAVRGMHYQRGPQAEMKIVRCLRGRVFDVAVDLRSGSPTFKKWVSVELSAENGNAIIIPEGCAHGFQVLEANSELLYLHTAYYTPACEGAVHFSDPALDIRWPLTATDVSDRDMNHPFLAENFSGL